jgi:hypothetical protein
MESSNVFTKAFDEYYKFMASKAGEIWKRRMSRMRAKAVRMRKIKRLYKEQI